MITCETQPDGRPQAGPKFRKLQRSRRVVEEGAGRRMHEQFTWSNSMNETPQIVNELARRLEVSDIFPVLEGGWFLPTWTVDRGTFQPPKDNVPTNEPGIEPDIVSTTAGSSGYYVLTSGGLGALHVLQCEEIYTFIEGNPVEVCSIDPGGVEKLETLCTGKKKHFVAEARTAHAVQSMPGESEYSLLHLVAIPGFEFADASIPSRDEFLALFPAHRELVERFTHAHVPAQPPQPEAVSYMTPCHETVKAVPLLTVGDDVGGVRFAGVPDGIGAYRDEINDNWMRVLITHEMFFHQGKTRAHGAPGAFVSEWVFDISEWKESHSFKVLSGEDLIRRQCYWSFSENRHKDGKSLPFERLCSADLAPQSALYFESSAGPLGTKARLFLSGEETHTQYRPDHGRALAHVVTGDQRGETWELPCLGRCSYENIPLNPLSQKKTIAVCLDDATNTTTGGYYKRSPGSEVYVYVGDKQEHSNPVTAAGLLDGVLYGVKVERFSRDTWKEVEAERREDIFGRTVDDKGYRFKLEALSDRRVDDLYDEPGVAQQKESLRLGVTRFLRVEDGAWDPRRGKEHWFYFVTTDKYDGVSRLFRLEFDDISRPEDGGRIEVLLSGKEGGKRRFQMLDSLTVDPWGRVILQEDAGDVVDELSRTLVFDPDTGNLREALKANANLFGSVADPLTANEESSGIIPVFDLLGEGWYLTNLQAHSDGKFPDALLAGLGSCQIKRLKKELVEPGQLLAVYIPKDVSALPET